MKKESEKNEERNEGYSEDEFDISPTKPADKKGSKKPEISKESKDSYSKDSDFKMNSLESKKSEKPNLGIKIQNNIKADASKAPPAKRNQDEGNVLLKSKETSNKNDDYDEDFEEVDKSLEKKTTQRRVLPPKAQSNRSHFVSPKGANNFHTRPNMSINTNINRYNESSKKARLSNTIVSSSDGMQNFNKSSMKTYLQKQMKLNDLQSVQHDLHDAKRKLRHAKKLRQKAETSGGDSQLILLNKENLMLKDELRHMSSSLNKFIGTHQIKIYRFNERAQSQETRKVKEIQPLYVDVQTRKAKIQSF